MNTRIDFQLHEALSGNRVTGRNCGAEAPVGTVFTVLCRRDFPSAAPGETIVIPEGVSVSSIALRLDSVEWYRRSIDLVPSGHTATLTLSGDGFDAVTEALSTAPARTHYSLCTTHETIAHETD